jgi:hypothetical protein
MDAAMQGYENEFIITAVGIDNGRKGNRKILCRTKKDLQNRT